MDWLATFEALKSIYQDAAYSNIAINEAINNHQGCNTGFVRTFTKGVIRDTMRLDFIVDKLANKGIGAVSKRTLIVLRMGIYAITSLDSIPDYAAVNESVKLARKVSKGQDKFINAILRNYLRLADEIVLPQDWSVKYSFPKGLVNLIKEQYGKDTESILKALNTPTALVIRVNKTKTTKDELVSILKTYGIVAHPTDESENALICESGNVIGTQAYKDGLFTVQSLSSIIAIDALSPKPGSRVLDMCAAPGGKSTAMAEIMRDDGEIIACDIYDHRLELINNTAMRLGINSITTCNLDGTIHNSLFENSFDYILADVPCSGLGVIPTKPEIKYKELENLEELTDIQFNILCNAVSYAKEGALIEYSTCTINKDENEGVVNRALEEFTSLEIVEKKEIMPYNNLIGFFYCILRKNA